MFRELYKNRKQFQSLRIKDEFLIIETDPLGADTKEYIQIDFINVKRIKVKLNSIQVQLVFKYEWKGKFNKNIFHRGKTPLIHNFSLNLNPSKRSEIIKFFELKGMIK